MALQSSLEAAGFEVEQRAAGQLPLRGNRSRTAVIHGKMVWGWRDRRGHLDVYVTQSGVPCSGAGLYAAVAIRSGGWVSEYTKVSVSAERVRARPELLQKAYVKLVGPRYIDVRDPEGRLRLGDGTLVNTHKFKHLDCTGARHSNPPLRLVRTEPCENRAFRLRCAIA